jgi:hypothetical protein
MKLLSLLFCSAFFISLNAQEKIAITSTTFDTTHSVKKAVIFSAVIPGAGQIYNHIAMPPKKKKAFWKVPLIYAGLGATGYLMLKNNSLQRSLKREYNLREATNFTQTFDTQWEQYDYQGVLNLYDQHLNRRDLFILAFGAVYIIQVVDAAVEAHFVSFDVSEDLTLNIHPTMMSLANPGLKLTLNFR